ncbi:MAG TPA: hypothetical protein PKD30_05860 [Saprospiraceae bacterium]|nr:hypothetical protein [Saprospiraceae bacterium]
MGAKRDFVKHVLNFMEDRKFIKSWEIAGDANRYDYAVELNSGNIAAIELKGCLDGNNTNIFERPAQAKEFIIWSVCTNPGADPRHNVWSGIHTRLSAEIISRAQQVDGVIIWDMVCGTIGRPCPKISIDKSRATEVGPFLLPPPCIYVLPSTIAHPRTNPTPTAQSINSVEFLQALHTCFKGLDEEINFVDFEVSYRGTDTVRKTRIRRSGTVQRESELTAIRRS